MAGSYLDLNINSIIFTLKPFLLIEKCFGIWRLKESSSNIATAAKQLSLLVPIVCAAYNFFDLYKSIPETLSSLSDWMSVVPKIPKLTNTLQYIFITIATTIMSDGNNEKVLRNIAQFDAMLYLNTTETFYKKCRNRSFKLLLAFAAGFISLMTSDIMTDDSPNIDYIITYPVLFIRNIESLMLYKQITMLKDRLSIINEKLSTFIQEKSCSLISNTTYDRCYLQATSNNKVRVLASVYNLLGKTTSMVNDLYNFQFFWILVTTFMYIVMTIWSSFYYFRTDQTDPNQLITMCIWCLSEIVCVGLISFNCERLLVIRNDCKILVNEIILDYDLPRFTRIQSKTFMELIEAWPLTFNVYDMFAVDITLMLKFISVATTYLIVIIQIFHFV